MQVVDAFQFFIKFASNVKFFLIIFSRVDLTSIAQVACKESNEFIPGILITETISSSDTVFAS